MEAPAMEAPVDVVSSVETPPAVQHDDALPKAALTPPTSEDNDPKREVRMSSELSDIDSDDGEDIEPDHYWEGGKIPVFKPVRHHTRGCGCRCAAPGALHDAQDGWPRT
jgi:hypothetical protein